MANTVICRGASTGQSAGPSPRAERVTALPDHDVRIETVGQLLEEASPLSVHACAHEGGCHRLLGCLLHIDRFSGDSPDGCGDVTRGVLTRARQLDDPFAAPALREQAR